MIVPDKYFVILMPAIVKYMREYRAAVKMKLERRDGMRDVIE